MQDVQQELSERSSHYDYVRTTGDQLLDKSDVDDEKTIRLRQDIERLVENWNKVEQLITERIRKYEDAIEKLQKFQVKHAHFNNILNLMLYKYLVYLHDL